MSEYKYPWQARQAARAKKPKMYISNRSKKGSKADRKYSVVRVKFLEEHPVCQCGAAGCKGVATEIHHKKGRGIWLCVIEFFLAVCWHCHKKIEKEPDWARANGYTVDRIE